MFNVLQWHIFLDLQFEAGNTIFLTHFRMHPKTYVLVLVDVSSKYNIETTTLPIVVPKEKY